jgi:hypothetical protein
MQTTEQTPKRADPRKRGFVPTVTGTLRNGRPDRKYLLANPQDQLHGLPILLDRGWQKVNGGKDGDKERVNGGKGEADGSVSFQGQVLVWISLDDWNDQQEYKRSLEQARHAKSRAQGGIDGIRDVDGNLAEDIEKSRQ